jgi:amidophosphoribosyltransferase
VSEEINHNCGLCIAHSLSDTYLFIKSLQHRGREATGIAAAGNKRIDAVKWKGPINTFDLTDLYKIFPSHDYHTYMAHVRYATRGRKDKILEDAHPHFIGGEVEDRGNHILIRNCEMVGVHNGQVNEKYVRGVDKQVLKTGCDTEALLYFFRDKGEREFLKQIPGSYTIAIADRKRKDIVVLRDRTGIKPGVLGWKDGKYGIASEDVAFRKNGGKFVEELDPGTIYYLSPDGKYKKEKVVEPGVSFCFFEWNYLADYESVLNGISVRNVRELLGATLAREFHPPDADLVTFLPRCPEAAARSYARAAGIPFLPLFYKMRGERAFQGSTMDERKKSIDENLYLVPHVNGSPIRKYLKGKVIISIDDSIVRGNNSKRERDLFYTQGGVKKVYHLNYTPQIGIMGRDGVPRGCLFGVDMPPDDNFIARGRTQKEISDAMGMQVGYISFKGMLDVYKRLGIPGENLCTYCIGGPHPLDNI